MFMGKCLIVLNVYMDLLKKKNYLEVAGCFPVRLLRSSLMKKMKVSGPMTIIFNWLFFLFHNSQRMHCVHQHLPWSFDLCAGFT